MRLEQVHIISCCVYRHECHRNIDESFSNEHGRSSRESVAVRIDDAARDAILGILACEKPAGEKQCGGPERSQTVEEQ